MANYPSAIAVPPKRDKRGSGPLVAVVAVFLGIAVGVLVLVDRRDDEPGVRRA